MNEYLVDYESGSFDGLLCGSDDEDLLVERVLVNDLLNDGPTQVGSIETYNCVRTNERQEVFVIV
jgi:hypothetical protein